MTKSEIIKTLYELTVQIEELESKRDDMMAKLIERENRLQSIMDALKDEKAADCEKETQQQSIVSQEMIDDCKRIFQTNEYQRGADLIKLPTSEYNKLREWVKAGLVEKKCIHGRMMYRLIKQEAA